MRSPSPTVEKSWSRSALDLLFPPRCAACATSLRLTGDGGEDAAFCPDCAKTLERLEAPFCQVCAEPFPGDLAHAFTCPNCAGMAMEFDFSVCGWMASGALREAIHRFKYEKQSQLRGALARFLRDALEDPRISGEPAWVLVPVPLHPRRRRERTFNQSEELARELAKLTGFPWMDALKRVRPTATQASLSRAGRLENLKGAFRLRRRAAALRGRPVLLIDDVFTTGSTACECARALRAAGPSKIAVAAVARG